MTDTGRGPAEGIAPLPDLIFYTRDGCHLCDESRDLIALLLGERAESRKRVPRVVERDITSNDDWLRSYFESIPVVVLGDRRVELALSAARLRRLFAEVLDGEAAETTADARP
jgi:Glutaredoxin-like domain (DUF836)